MPTLYGIDPNNDPFKPKPVVPQYDTNTAFNKANEVIAQLGFAPTIKSTQPTNQNTQQTIGSVYSNLMPNSTTQSVPDFYAGLSTSGNDTQSVRQKTLDQFQAEIDAVNRIYAEQLAQAKKVGEGQLGSSAARQARRGLLGGDFGAAQTNAVEEANRARENEVLARQQRELQGIYKEARGEAQTQEDVIATDIATTAIGAGIDLTKLSVEDLNSIAAQYGVSPLRVLSAYQTNLPEAKAAEGIKSYNVDGTLVNVDPVTGETTVGYQGSPKDEILSVTEAKSLGVPYGTTRSQAYGTAFADTTGKELLTPTEAEKLGVPYGTTREQAYGKLVNAQPSDQLYSGLSSTTSTAVRSLVGKYGSEPTVQNFATIQDGYNFAQSIDTKTTNPADDQALIYSLAKALDPGSVVREGEYATAQKYAQSWVNAYGKGIEQALLGTGFLSQAARNNIKKTIAQKYESSKKSYENVNKQYTSKINSLTGRNDADSFLVDYMTPTPQDQQDALLQYLTDNPDATDEQINGWLDSQSFNTVGGADTNQGTRAQRNNNPLNIKVSAATSTYPGVVGIEQKPASDGGNFLQFSSPEAGFAAAKRLIQNPNYASLTVDQAMKRWSNSGYGGEIAPQIANIKISQLTSAQLDALIQAMAKREGYYA